MSRIPWYPMPSMNCVVIFSTVSLRRQMPKLVTPVLTGNRRIFFPVTPKRHRELLSK
jgi:hypothetical protein